MARCFDCSSKGEPLSPQNTSITGTCSSVSRHALVLWDLSFFPLFRLFWRSDDKHLVWKKNSICWLYFILLFFSLSSFFLLLDSLFYIKHASSKTVVFRMAQPFDLIKMKSRDSLWSREIWGIYTIFDLQSFHHVHLCSFQQDQSS